MVFCIAILILGAVPVSATEITLSPDQVVQGDTITIDIKDLSNDSTFTLLIESAFRVTPGKDFSFKTTDFYMPISLKNGELSAYTENTLKTTLGTKKGETEMSVGKKSDAYGIFTITESQSIPSGKFDYISIDGTPLPDKDTIRAKLQMSGKKSGPDSSKISFIVTGIENGEIYITALVNGSPVLSKKVTVGSGLASPASASTKNIFYSVDRKVSVTTSNVDHLEIVSVQQNAIPPTWVLINKTYMVLFDQPAFPSGTTISFTVPKLTGADYAYFIGSYDGTRWSSLPSGVSGDTTVTATIGKAGTYGLMAYAPENSVSQASAPSDSNAPVSVQKPPKIASIAQSSPLAKTTQTPSGIVPVCGALIIMVLVAGLFRKRH
jgi:hypothetical protein